MRSKIHIKCGFLSILEGNKTSVLVRFEPPPSICDCFVLVDQKRVFSGGYQQHPELGRCAQHLRERRAGPDQYGHAADSAGHGAAADQEQPLLRLHQAGQGQPPPHPLHEVSSYLIFLKVYLIECCINMNIFRPCALWETGKKTKNLGE